MFSEDNVLTCGQGKAGNNSLARCSGLVRHHRPQGYVLPGVVLCPNPAFLPKVLTEFHLTRQLSYDHSPPLKETRRVSSSCCARSGPWQSTSGAHRPSGRLINCSPASNPVIWAHPCPSLDSPTGLWEQSSLRMCSQACLSRTGFEPTRLVVWLPHGPCGGVPLLLPYVQQPHGHPSPRFQGFTI